MTTTLTLPKWYDLHAHFRQGDLLPPLLAAHYQMGCAGILAMPNTRPSVGKVFEDEPGDFFSVEGYTAMLREAGGDVFKTIITPIYLTPSLTPQMIERGAKAGVLRAAKYYPPHGTTNSGDSAAMELFMKNGVIQALQDNNVILCIHGEEHGLSGEAYYGRHTNAEESFYRTVAQKLAEKFSKLKLIAEHITTKVAADFVHAGGDNIAATITPQHLMYTVGDLLQGLKYHLYCMPLVKYEDDVKALCAAATSANNSKFFAGTDSAPHTTKVNDCCGSAGCYTGGIAPQLYAEAFEKAGANLDTPAAQTAFKNFLCLNGAKFYGLEVPKETFTLSRKPQQVSLISTASGTITPLPIGMQNPAVKSTSLPWSVEL